MQLFSKQDMTIFVEEVGTHKESLFGKFSSSLDHAQKQKNWDSITDKLNSISSEPRIVSKVMDKLVDLASRESYKKEIVSHEERSNEKSKTGGGPPTEEKLSKDEKKIVDILRPVVTEGIPGGIDSAPTVNSISGSDSILQEDTYVDNDILDDAEVNA